jgi:hypothetical protein
MRFLRTPPVPHPTYPISFDVDNSKTLSQEELTLYFTAVFETMFRVDGRLEVGCGMTAAELAVTTAGECFREADVDHDGVVTLEEFKAW